VDKTFKRIKEEKCDAILIMPSTTDPDETTIQGLTYKQPGDKIGGSSMGDLYDILTFKQTGENSFGFQDHFQAILVCPYTYTEKLFNEGNLGLVARVTTTSQDMVSRISRHIGELIEST
jgi:hypothetical protein